MGRTFEAMDLVQLPRFDVAGAQALGTEMLAAASGKHVPDAVGEALAELTASHRDLQNAAARRLPTSGAGDPTRAKAADAALDAAWSALYDIVSGWAKLPDHPHGAVAARLLLKLFPDGVKFVHLAYKLEWAESDTRLLVIKQQELEADLQTLGCAALFKRLCDAHKAYGDALAVTTGASEPETVNLRDALADFNGALRDYVVQVTASVRKKDAGTAVLAQELLTPLQNWETPGGDAGKTSPTPEPPAPAPAPVNPVVPGSAS